MSGKQCNGVSLGMLLGIQKPPQAPPGVHEVQIREDDARVAQGNLFSPLQFHFGSLPWRPACGGSHALRVTGWTQTRWVKAGQDRTGFGLMCEIGKRTKQLTDDNKK